VYPIQGAFPAAAACTEIDVRTECITCGGIDWLYNSTKLKEAR
jgi:hypothetical protein